MWVMFCCNFYLITYFLKGGKSKIAFVPSSFIVYSVKEFGSTGDLQAPFWFKCAMTLKHNDSMLFFQILTFSLPLSDIFLMLQPQDMKEL